jgi:hypothetical protein
MYFPHLFEVPKTDQWSTSYRVIIYCIIKTNVCLNLGSCVEPDRCNCTCYLNIGANCHIPFGITLYLHSAAPPVGYISMFPLFLIDLKLIYSKCRFVSPFHSVGGKRIIVTGEHENQNCRKNYLIVKLLCQIVLLISNNGHVLPRRVR